MTRTLIGLLLLLTITIVESLYIVSTNEIVPHIPADFGPVPHVTGSLAFAKPIKGCEEYSAETVGRVRGKIAMIARGDCSFIEKVLRAQSFGAIGVVIANNESGLISSKMGADGVHSKELVKIPSVMIGNQEAKYIAALAQMFPIILTMDSTGLVDPSKGSQGNDDSESTSATIQALNNIIQLIIFMAASFPTLWVFWITCLMGGRVLQRCWDKVRRRRKLETIPTVYYSPDYSHQKDDPEYVHNNSCVICLDEFVEGQTLKRLPCMHAFCVDCIQSWLADRSDQCPICKKSILVDDADAPCITGFCTTVSGCFTHWCTQSVRRFSVWRHRRSRRPIPVTSEDEPNPIGMERIRVEHYCDDDH
jgi:E3 ubiquitin-protein ligase RNF13